MADIELVIKIPEEQYDLILKSDIGATSVFVSKECMMHSIKNGTPLPEHHSDLIDRSELLKKEVWGSFGEIGDDAPCVFKADIEEAPTIIPATDKTLFDKMEEEFGKDWDVPKRTSTKEGDK